MHRYSVLYALSLTYLYMHITYRYVYVYVYVCTCVCTQLHRAWLQGFSADGAISAKLFRISSEICFTDSRYSIPTTKNLGLSGLDN